MTAWLAGILIVLAGWATQRGSTCAVAAVESLLLRRDASRLAGFALAAALAFVLFNAARLAGVPVTMRFEGRAVDGHALLGGLVFGVGAWLNGRCAMGTIARLCSGELTRIGTLLGFFVGAALVAQLSLPGQRGMMTSVIAQLLPGTGLVLGLGLALLFGWAVCRFAVPSDDRKEWSPIRTMAQIGLVSGLLLVIAPGWPYTNVLINIAAGKAVMAPALVSFGLLLLGAISAAVASRSFAFETGNVSSWSKSAIGGVFMGAGAATLPGGNDTMLLVGLPLLLPHLLVAYAAMLLTIAIMVLVGRAMSWGAKAT